MKILHYFLGFPPYRSGGLTKFCVNVMQAQCSRGDTVCALWPGEMSFFSDVPHIRKKKPFGSVENFELCNPLPVPLDEGILRIDAFTAPCDIKIYAAFLKMLSPDVIHVHTLMGIHREFFVAAHKLHIRIVFTTHDYFGICPKVTLYRQGHVCKEDCQCADCLCCNLSALSLKKIMLMQSGAYRLLKDSPPVKKLRQRHRQSFFEETQEAEKVFSSPETAKQYQRLRNYYLNMLKLADMIHFNSSVAEQVYKKYFTPTASCVITISNKEIQDNRSVQQKPSEKIRFTYLSPAKAFKGFGIIKNTFDQLWNEGKRDFVLKLYTPVSSLSPYMQVQPEGFQREELKNIFSETDVLLAPSVWYETFGFTVLEAISYGIPVIVSDNVGAKDIIGTGGRIVSAGSVSSFREAVLSVTKETVQDFKKNIRTSVPPKTWDVFVSELYQILT